MSCHHPRAFVFLTLLCILLLVDGQPGFTQPPGKKSDPNDLSNLFKWTSKGKDTIQIAEMPPLRGKEEMELFAKENGITNGQLTQEQFQKYFKQLDELRKKTAKDPKKIALEEQAVDREAEQIFFFHDFNDDGFWNAEEMAKLHPNYRAFKNEWQKWDANRDGLIDLSEFKAYFRDYTKRRNDGQANASSGSKGNQSQANAPSDSKGNKSQASAPSDPKGPTRIIEEDDDEEVPVYYHHKAKLPAGLPKWFTELDLNQDGQISMYEWQKANRDIEEFVSMDRNDDGFLTAEEVLRFLKKLTDLSSSSHAHFHKRHHESQTLAKTKSNLNEFLERTKAKSNINKLLENMMARQNNNKLRENLVAKPKAKKIQENTKPDKKSSPNIIVEEDDEEVPVYYHYGAKLPAGLPKWFTELDRNQDGQISLDEWQTANRDLEEFVKMDRNGDSRLTAEEILLYLKKPIKLNSTGQLHIQDTLDEPTDARYQGKKAYKIFTIQLEQGKTYQIELLSEIFYAYLYLEDADGKILDKHNSGGRKLMARIVHQAAETGIYHIIATSQDGYKAGPFSLTVRVLPHLGGVALTGLPAWFSDLDKDLDGQISLQEWQKGGKNLNEFAEYDRNHDDLITAVEVLAYVKKQFVLKLTNGQASYSGTLDGAAEEKYRDKKIYQIFTLQLEQGKTYQFDHVSKAFDAYLYLEDDEGEVLAEDDDSGGNLNSRIIHRATRTGTYRLIAMSLNGNQRGAFSLAVRVLSNGGAEPKGLPSWFKDLDKKGEGQISLHEWDKAGKNLKEFHDYDRNDDGFITADEVLHYLKKSLVLKFKNGQSSYSGTIEESVEERYRGKKSFQMLTIHLEQGKIYQIDHRSKVFQGYLYLVDDEGNIVQKNSSRTIGDNCRLVYQAAESGTYRIIATSLGGFRTGDYVLSVRVIHRYGDILAKDLPPWFIELDKNEDGQVSLLEWKEGGKNLDEFSRYDRNGDGFLTAAEVLRSLKK